MDGAGKKLLMFMESAQQQLGGGAWLDMRAQRLVRVVRSGSYYLLGLSSRSFIASAESLLYGVIKEESLLG